MQKRKEYIGKGNTELNPSINPLDRILYEFDDSQYSVFSSIKIDLNEPFTKNILLGGARGCGKSSLINLATEFKQNLVLKVDCSIADEEADLLTLVANELEKKLDCGEIAIASELFEEAKRLIREVTFSSTNIYKESRFVSLLEDDTRISDSAAKVYIPLEFLGLKLSVQKRLSETLALRKDKAQDFFQERATAYFERKEAFSRLIDIINEISGKKLIFVFDEIDKHNVDFLDKVFDKYKTFFTSGKSTNIFLINISQYYHISCGGACDNIDGYFDKKYFLRSTSFSLFKDISYNKICSSVALEINYYLNQGVFRNIYAGVADKSRNIPLLLKAEYYIKLVQFVNSCDELEDFVKEILITVLNKILKRGFVGNDLSFNNLKQICAEEFSAFKNIQLEGLTLYVLKSCEATNECWISLNEDKLTVDYSLFKEQYAKDLYNSSDNNNSSTIWGNHNKEIQDIVPHIHNSDFSNVNDGLIRLGNYDGFEFQLIRDSNNSHNDIIKTLSVSVGINAFIIVKKGNTLGHEFGYVFFIDSSYKGRYVLYYDNASWSYEDMWVKGKIDNFILAHDIKAIEIEVDSDFKPNKESLKQIVWKYNQHENISKEWANFTWL